MQQMDCFIDYDPNGQPFVGIMVTEQTMTVKFYVGHKGNIQHNINEITRQLKQIAHELNNVPVKLVEVKGVNDAAFRKSG